MVGKGEVQGSTRRNQRETPGSVERLARGSAPYRVAYPCGGKLCPDRLPHSERCADSPVLPPPARPTTMKGAWGLHAASRPATTLLRWEDRRRLSCARQLECRRGDASSGQGAGQSALSPGPRRRRHQPCRRGVVRCGCAQKGRSLSGSQSSRLHHPGRGALPLKSRLPCSSRPGQGRPHTSRRS